MENIDLYDETIKLSTRYNLLNEQHYQNSIYQQDFNVELAKITNTLITIINKAFSPSTKDIPQTKTKQPYNLWLATLLLLLGIVSIFYYLIFPPNQNINAIITIPEDTSSIESLDTIIQPQVITSPTKIKKTSSDEEKPKIYSDNDNQTPSEKISKPKNTNKKKLYIALKPFDDRLLSSDSLKWLSRAFPESMTEAIYNYKELYEGLQLLERLQLDEINAEAQLTNTKSQYIKSDFQIIGGCQVYNNGVVKITIRIIKDNLLVYVYKRTLGNTLDIFQLQEDVNQKLDQLALDVLNKIKEYSNL